MPGQGRAGGDGTGRDGTGQASQKKLAGRAGTEARPPPPTPHGCVPARPYGMKAMKKR